MAEPVIALTASVIASLAFQEFVKSGAGDLAKRFTGEAIALAVRAVTGSAIGKFLKKPPLF